jgi:hypothetical protein
MRVLRVVGLLVILLGCAACATSTQRGGDAGARTDLALGPEEWARPAALPPCPQVAYRLPIVTQVTVPDTIVGGVLIPQHTTYVVLQPGVWQVVASEPVRQSGAPTVPPGCTPPSGAH